MTTKVLFVDRDGTLIEEPPDYQVDAVNKVRLVANVIPALLEFMNYGYRLVMVSNQDGLGTDSFAQEDFDAAHEHALSLFASQGIHFDEVFICPHLPGDNCACRKPRTGLLAAYLAKTNINLDRSAVIGDRDTDLQLASAIGIRGVLVNSLAHEKSRTWPQIVDLLCHAERTGRVCRNTNETNISVSVNLDGPSHCAVASGIGFFDHMLEQLSSHGGFGLELTAVGDTHIDEHHTVEDTAICLGQALREALDDKIGIGRYGFVVPMDESQARVSLDLSGRSSFQFVGEFPRRHVGEMSTEMVRHFFDSLADSLGAALHIEVHGENAHHMIEACFKCTGRALRQAFARSSSDLPSTKGVL